MDVSESCEQQSHSAERLRGTALWFLGRASLRAQHYTHEQLAKAGIRKWHYGVLAVVAERGPTTQAAIGRRLRVDRSDMVALLNDLEAAGYVHREPDPADRRRNSVTITAEGKRALKEFDALVLEAERMLLEPLSSKEREQLLGLLERIVTAPCADRTDPADPGGLHPRGQPKSRLS